jgi:hypothetical protein
MVRMAKCSMCKTTTPSKDELPFFEFTGEKSRRARESCKHCMYYKVAHEGGSASVTCGNFVPHGAYETDRYYCGCIGWD